LHPRHIAHNIAKLAVIEPPAFRLLVFKAFLVNFEQPSIASKAAQLANYYGFAIPVPGAREFLQTLVTLGLSIYAVG
jgi:hypothetical protein